VTAVPSFKRTALVLQPSFELLAGHRDTIQHLCCGVNTSVVLGQTACFVQRPLENRLAHPRVANRWFSCMEKCQAPNRTCRLPRADQVDFHAFAYRATPPAAGPIPRGKGVPTRWERHLIRIPAYRERPFRSNVNTDSDRY
jgi:hypothetical protein